jgi:hypothetical protein
MAVTRAADVAAPSSSPPITQQTKIDDDAFFMSKEAAAHASSWMNVAAGAAAFVASVCSASCGRTMAVISGVSWLLAGVANHASIDSGRVDFKAIPVPSLPSLPQDYKDMVPKVVSTVIDDINQMGVYTQAMVDTAARAEAAAAANSTEWVNKQRQAFDRYRAQFNYTYCLLQRDMSNPQTFLDEVELRMACSKERVIAAYYYNLK